MCSPPAIRHANIFPGHPSFAFARAKGIAIGNSGWEHVIAVNQVGKRFYSETAIPNSAVGNPKYPPGTDGTRKPFTATDWRNASTAQIKAQYQALVGDRCGACDQRGLTAPRTFSLDRCGRSLIPPRSRAAAGRFVIPTSPIRPTGTSTRPIPLPSSPRRSWRNAHQKMPLKYLEQTVRRYNELRRQGRRRGLREAGDAQDRHPAVLRRLGTDRRCSIRSAACG